MTLVVFAHIYIKSQLILANPCNLSSKLKDEIQLFV